MISFAIGLFVMLHGLVHLWLVALSQRLVPFEPAMGWTGASWAFTGLLGDSTTRALASVLLVLATAALVAGGAGIAFRSEWGRPVLVAAALGSSTVLLLLWDGRTDLLVQKGLIGLLINAAIVALASGQLPQISAAVVR